MGVLFLAGASRGGVAPCRDLLSPVALRDVKVRGHVGKVQDRFFANRIFSDFAKNEIWKEARDAFAYPDDDVCNKPAGMWKGEFWGKLMISACRVAEYSGDTDLEAFLRDEAHRLVKFQRADGYLGTYVNAEWVMPPDTNEAQRVFGWPCYWNWNLWCRKYTLWGLLACYRLSGDKDILRAADRAMTQEIEMLRRLGVRIEDTGTLTMRGLPPCSVLKPLLLLYEETGKDLYLEFAKEIYGAWNNPKSRAPQFAAKLSSGSPLQDWYPEENGEWGKAYEMMSCLAGVVELYRVTGDQGALSLAKGMRDRIYEDELNLCYSVGYNDQFWGARRHLNGVSEPCDAIHWMRLNHELYLVTGDAKYADEIERCFYNAFLASVSPDGKWGARCVRSHGRHQIAPPQAGMRYQHCCVDNMPRGFMDVAQTILAKDAEGALRVAIYHDSEAGIGNDHVVIRGNYPIRAKVSVSVSLEKQGKVKFRKPAWCPLLRINNERDAYCEAKDGWIEVLAPAGESRWNLVFAREPRIVDSYRRSVKEYDRNSAVYKRWAEASDSPATGERDLFPLLRTTPAAQVVLGPLMLAKSVRLGLSERDVLGSETVNLGGWSVSVEMIDVENVWGAWRLSFEKGDREMSLPVCDYSSAAVWGRKGVEFGVFF